MSLRGSPWVGLLVSLASCTSTSEPGFQTGPLCPGPGRARAGQIAEGDPTLAGPDAIGGPGDWLLVNDKAAFVVQSVERIKSYYYYGGILVDAAPMEGCVQAAPERFGEIGMILAQGRLAEFTSSVMRTFEGESVEVIGDGSDGGEARLRVHGSDQFFWLLELELLKAAFSGDKDKRLSTPYGVELYVDYVLPPDSAVLRIEMHLRNTGAEEKSFQGGLAVIFGDTTRAEYYSRDGVELSGYGARYGVPWITSTSTAGDGAWSLARVESNLATSRIAGVDAVLDFDEVVLPTVIAPAGQSGDSATFTYLVSVGATDANSASRNLQKLNRMPAPERTYGLRTFEGRVVDALGSGGVAGAEVEVQMEDDEGVWRPLDSFISREDGAFGGQLPDFGLPLRLYAQRPGTPPPPSPVMLGSGATSAEVTLPARGTLEWEVKDPSGRRIPAKLLLFRDGPEVYRQYGAPEHPPAYVAPGEYELVIARGYEWTIHSQVISIPAGGTVKVSATLEHVVDTTGFMSADGHMHGGPSADSTVSIADRMTSAAGEGLDVAIATDHEIVSDWRPGITARGLEDFVATVSGQEVTASLPEHTNMFPVPPRPEALRGDPVRWYGKGLGEIWQLQKARGAGISVLNHPRAGCNYLCLVGYDRITGRATLEDATKLGLPAGTDLMPWNFDAVEYTNGHQEVFLDPRRPDRTGLFEDWMSFLNLGHKITATGVTDVHGFDDPGSPRTYFESSTDAPRDLVEADLVRGYKEGRALVSSGAFARVRMNGNAGMGDTVTDTDGTADLHVTITALPSVDVTRFEVFANCDQVLTSSTTSPGGLVKFDGDVRVPIPRDAHVVVLGFGEGHMPRGLVDYAPRRVPRFTTNAIYVDADGNGRWDPPGGKTCRYPPR